MPSATLAEVNVMNSCAVERDSHGNVERSLAADNSCAGFVSFLMIAMEYNFTMFDRGALPRVNDALECWVDQ